MAESESRIQGFWARQFSPKATPDQAIFDFGLGIVLPILCLVYDPIVFRGSLMPGSGAGLFERFVPAAYFFIGLSALVLAVWLLSRRFGLLLAGPLVAGAAVSLGLGVALLPISIPMSIVGIGLLGLIPFVTSFVFLRNAVRALGAARARHGVGTVAWAALLLGGLTLGVPAGGHVYVKVKVDRAIQRVLTGDPTEQARGVRTLRVLHAFAPMIDIERAWAREEDPARRDRLALLYEEITGTQMRTASD